jgi:hypothetical protein
MAKFARSRPQVFFFLTADDQSYLEQAFPHELRLLDRQKNCILLGYEGK